MPNLHFVYAGDPNNGYSYAPFTITRNLYKFLQPKFDNVYYYDWCQDCEMQPVKSGDVVLGHPNYPPNTPTRRLFEMAKHVDCFKALIFPLHHAMPDINLPFNDLAIQADAIFSICGPYWYDTLPSSSFAHWQPKITRLDIAVDLESFPFTKTGFRAAGTRRFLYIGSSRPEKNLDLLADIFAHVPYDLDVYGQIDHPKLARMKNVRMRGWANIDHAFLDKICASTDVFVNTSCSDANPTTCTEAASYGLVVACTPQSGYHPDQPFWGLNPTNIGDNVELLRHAQWCDEYILLQQAQKQRLWVEQFCTWPEFCRRVGDRLAV